MSVLPEHAQLSEVCEVFTTSGDLLSYYPVTMEAFVGTEQYHKIAQMAVVMSRTMRVNGEDVGPEHFLGLHPREWNEYVEHLDLP